MLTRLLDIDLTAGGWIPRDSRDEIVPGKPLQNIELKNLFCHAGRVASMIETVKSLCLRMEKRAALFFKDRVEDFIYWDLNLDVFDI